MIKICLKKIKNNIKIPEAKKFEKYIVAALATIVFFVSAYDFVFGGKSSLAIHYERPFLDSKMLETSGKFSDVVNRETGDSWIDIGGSAFQTNPISYVVNNSESLFWTDLIASGNGIIEDFTFQPLSSTNIASTLFGPGLKYVHWSFVSLLFLSLLTFSFYLNERVGVEAIPSVVGGVLYAFSGFVTSGWSNSVTMPYIIFPIALMAISYYSTKEIGVLIPILATTLLLANTFLPVLLLMLMAVIILIFLENEKLELKDRLAKVFIRVVPIYCIGFALLSFIYVPAFLEFASSGAFDEYNSKSNDFYLPIKSLFVLLGPLHPWRNFNSLHFDNSDLWNYGGFSVIYTGLVGIYLVLLSLWSRSKLAYGVWLVLALCLLRLFSPLAYYVQYVPIIRSISYGYFFSLISVLMAVLAGLGAQLFLNYQSKLTTYLPLFIVLCIEVVYFKIAEGSSIRNIQIVISVLLIFSLAAIVNVNNKSLRGIFLLFLVISELYFLQNHNKVIFKELDQIQLRAPIQQMLNDPSMPNYRLLNTGFQLLPPNISAALGVSEISTMGHLSLDKKYRDLYAERIGSDDKLYSVHGFTDCRNLKFDQEYFDLMSVKYILTDRANCASLFSGRYPIAFEDSSVVIFKNPTAIGINELESKNECDLEINKKQFGRVYVYKNCHGKLNLRLNFKKDFRYFQNGLAVSPDDLYPFGKQFNVSGDGVIQVDYSRVYIFSSFISFVFFLVLILGIYLKFRRGSDVSHD